jgi:hypothetical protein
MAKLPRETQLVFGSTPGFDQMTQFGSTANNSTVYTTNIAQIQGLSNYLVGWYDAVISGSFPIIQDMNAIHYLYAYQLAYLFQAGVPEWDSGTTYYVGSRANDGNGNLYTSIADSNTNHALTNSTYWLPPGAALSSNLSTALTIPSGYNWNVSFLTIASSTTVTIAGTSVMSAKTIVNGTLIITGTVHTN